MERFLLKKHGVWFGFEQTFIFLNAVLSIGIVVARKNKKKAPSAFLVIILVLLLVGIVGFAAITSIGERIAFPRIVFESEDGVEIVGIGRSSISHHNLDSAYISLSESPVVFSDPETVFHVSRGIFEDVKHEFAVSIGSVGLVKSLADARLSFDVVSTNNYGTLVLKMGGEIVWMGVPRTGERVEFSLDPSDALLVPGLNTLTLSTTSSGWRIWAPSTYTLANLSVMEDCGKRASTTLLLSLTSDEVESAVRDLSGRLIFTVDSTTPSRGKIGVQVNNVSIWTGVPPAGASYRIFADFSKALVGLSESNEITFILEPPVGDYIPEQGYFVDDVAVLVFGGEDLTRYPVIDFELDDRAIQDLKEGRLYGKIDFEITRTIKQGNLTAIIKSERLGEEDGSEKRVQFRPRSGEFLSFSFGGDDVRVGENQLMLQSSDGMFEITGLRITLLPNV